MRNRGGSISQLWIRSAAAAFPLVGCAVVAALTAQGVITREAIEDVTAPTLALGVFACLQTQRRRAGHARAFALELAFLWLGLLGLSHTLAAIATEERSSARSLAVVQLGTVVFSVLALLSILPLQWSQRRIWRRVALGSVTGAAVLVGAFGPTTFGTFWLHDWTAALAGSIGAALLAAVVVHTLLPMSRAQRARVAGSAGMIAGLCVAAVDSFVTGWGQLGDGHPALRVFFEVALPLAPLLGLVIDDLLTLRRSAHARLRLSLIAMLFAMIAMATALSSLIGPDAAPSHRLLVLGLLAPAFVVTVMVTIANRTIMARLDDLAAVTRRYASGDLKSRAPIGPGDEISRLALAFNGLAERISYQAQELRLLAEMMKESGEAMLVVDVQRRIAFSNRAFTAATGWSRMAVVGRPYDALFSDSLDAAQRSDIWQAALTRGKWSKRVAVRGRDGRTEEMEVQVLAVRREHELLGFVAIHRDLAMARDLEREREAYTDGLFKISRTAQMLLESLDSDSVRTRTVDVLFEEFGAECRLWMMERPAGQGPQLVAAASHRRDGFHRVPRLVTSVATDRRPIIIDDRSERRARPEESSDGRNGAIGVFPIALDDELIGVLEIGLPEPIAGRSREVFLILARLVTGALLQAEMWRRVARQEEQQRNLNRRLERSKQRAEVTAAELQDVNEKLTESSRLKTMFLSTASHELRTPVSSVLGFLRLLMDDVAESEEERKQFLHEAHACGEHLLAVVNDVLDVARIEAGRIHLDMRDIEIAEVFDEVRALTGAGLAEATLDVTFEVEDGVMAWADPQRCRQALVNLVGNAMKFTIEGSVRVTAVEDLDRGHVRIEVVDTGVGLDPKNCERVFDAFVQAESGDTRRFGGSGLGLAITRRLVTLMGGSLRLESEGLGFGCRAICTLPLSRERVGERPAPDDPLPEQSVVLLVDGDNLWLRRCADSLRAAGHAVLTATTADEAWPLIRRHRPRLICSEYALPCGDDAERITGIDLARAILAEDALSDCELALVTGQPTAAEPLISGLSGMSDLVRIERPCDPEMLVTLIWGLQAVSPRC